MSIKLKNTVKQALEDRDDLFGAPRRILLAIAQLGDDAGGRIYPSVAWICAEASLSRASVFRGLKVLKSLGILIETGAVKCATGATKLYRIAISTLFGDRPAPASETCKGSHGDTQGVSRRDTRELGKSLKRAEPVDISTKPISALLAGLRERAMNETASSDRIARLSTQFRAARMARMYGGRANG